MLQIVSSARNYDLPDRSVERYTVNFFYCTKHRAEETSSCFTGTAGSYCLIYLLSGEMGIGSESVKKGDMIFFAKLSHRPVEVYEGCEWLCVMFDYSHSMPMLHKREYCLIHASTQMRELVESLYVSASYRATMPGVREAMLLVILNEANRMTRSEAKSIALYGEACEWIEKHATRAISVEEVAHAMGYTREHLNRIFRTAGGQSVGSFIAKARLWEIEQLCRVKELPSAEIAKRLDFASAELLCKFFRYHKGMSLHQYRTANTV